MEMEAEDSYIDLIVDDCLLQICSYLSIYDLLNLRKVSRRFDEITKIAFRSHRRLRLKLRDLNLDYIQEIFKFIVIPNVRSLFMSGGAMINLELRDRLLEHIPQCKNLVQLELMYFRLDEKLLVSFRNIFKNLEYLSLNRCEIEDFKMIFVTDLTNLTKLNLTGNINISGVNLPKIKSNLTELHLQFCSSLEFQYFAEYLYTNVDQLRVLDISFDKMLYDENLLNVIAETQHNLEILKIGEIKIENFEAISRMKRLKSFCCHQMTAFSLKVNVDRLVEDLSCSHLNLIELDISFCELTASGQAALQKFNSLETLRVKRLQTGKGFNFLTNLSCLNRLTYLDVSFCYLTDEIALEIVNKSPNLKFISLENNPSITSLFLEKVVTILDKQIANGSRKCKLKINIRPIVSISNKVSISVGDNNLTLPMHRFLCFEF